MDELELSATIAAIRTELLAAMEDSDNSGIHFPLGPIQLEFQVGVTRAADGKAGVRLWVIEFGSGGSVSRQDVQKITVTLEPPVDHDGMPVKVHRSSGLKP
ncbi:trypco2 family protein [Microbispora sp. CA-135349]|uniref:trypco2 family protein n=1 Tax=Microbispora sp. CA-135349 TaxID=3239953 RepID=UPI003D8BCD70